MAVLRDDERTMRPTRPLHAVREGLAAFGVRHHVLVKARPFRWGESRWGEASRRAADEKNQLERNNENMKTKLKKYTVKVTGVVVDGVGHGVATCKKPVVSWTVKVQ